MNTSINSNIKFNGFSNTVTVKNYPMGDSLVSYISTKLNNDGEPDLDKYQKIRELQGLLTNKKTDNVATFTYIFDKNKNKESLFFNEKTMFWGDELKALEENHVPKLMSAENYKKEENIHMKVYTLLASLTKRMSNMKLSYEDNITREVLESLYKTFNHIFLNQKETMDLLRYGCLKLTPFQELASNFNNAVAHTMKQFFK